MSSAERLQTMERLWDALCHEAEKLPSPLWHGVELSRRKARIESGEARFFTLEEARKQLRR